jgi:hypothetical protein
MRSPPRAESAIQRLSATFGARHRLAVRIRVRLVDEPAVLSGDGSAGAGPRKGLPRARVPVPDRGHSPTPYGLGVVDIALITALTRAGLASPDAVGAVLLYRIITFKIVVTFGWIGYRRVQDHIGRAVG